MASKKKKIIDNTTFIDSSFLQAVFGGDTKTDKNSPNYNGHFHDDRVDEWGHAPKIDLTKHTTGRLTLQDQYVVSKTVSAYPSIIAAQTNILSGSFLNVPNSNINSMVSLDGPSSSLSELDGYFNALATNIFPFTNLATPLSPFTSPDILISAIWYFAIPFDMDITKSSYFSFGWMGDILTLDGYGNTIVDSTKLGPNGSMSAQTTIFRITWQWYSAGYAIFPPAVIYDGATPANIPGTNVNTNVFTRGRIPNMIVNDYPFKLIINNSSSNNQNYVGLTGLQQATNAVVLGVQVDVLNSGFVNPSLGYETGHLTFFHGNFIYFSKTLGSQVITFKTF